MNLPIHFAFMEGLLVFIAITNLALLLRKK